jgi:hypothetical protein
MAYATSDPRTRERTQTPLVLVHSDTRGDAADQSARNYFEEWEQDQLSRDQRDIARLMRANRADFLG